jgi:[NiFe] hydrogenase diaphorase moiety large subunit
VSEEAIEGIAESLGIRRLRVKDTATFYHFLSTEPCGKNVVRLCNAVVERLNGMREVAVAFEKAVGVPFGNTSSDGAITLEYTPCIGMSDQPPSALVNGLVMTQLRPEMVPGLVEDIRAGEYLQYRGRFVSSPTVGVLNNLRKPGPVVFSHMERGAAIRKAVNLTPEEVIAQVTDSRLRGRGGAGFPTGMKWEFCRKAPGKSHYLICNADEGEPGTFKDRVILTEVPDLVFEGMTIGAYAIGATEGLFYLRGEYQYLHGHLEEVLQRRRAHGLLGKNICGKEGFNFDIRIQMGAGAYVCGEESSLIESLEGKRGAPRDRPPFPVTKGYLDEPSSVNNCETFCSAARVIEKGPEWFRELGLQDSTGTKVLSVSGDCEAPGVYEVEFGTTIDELLKLVGAKDAGAVQVGGAAGTMVAPKDFGRTIAFKDLSTGGSIMVFNSSRDILQIVRHFAEFFAQESCGWCAPCRIGTTLQLKLLDKILAGSGTQRDLDELADHARTMELMSRCGLGQTAGHPVLSTMRNFADLYTQRLQDEEFIPRFDFKKAIAESVEITGRAPALEE